MNIEVKTLRLYDPDTLRFVVELLPSPESFVIRGENSGHRVADGRIVGTMAGFVTQKVDGLVQEQAFTAKGWTSGFEKTGKGNPGKRDRDIALAMAVGFEEYKHRVSGANVPDTVIFEALHHDAKWHLHDAESFGKAFQRGTKLLKAACFTVFAKKPQSDDDSSVVDVVALVKERNSEFNVQSQNDWSYIGFPWFWRRGHYTIERTDLVCPVRLTCVGGVCSYDRKGAKVKDS